MSSPLHKRKAPLLTTFWRRFCVEDTLFAQYLMLYCSLIKDDRQITFGCEDILFLGWLSMVNLLGLINKLWWPARAVLVELTKILGSQKTFGHHESTKFSKGLDTVQNRKLTIVPARGPHVVFFNRRIRCQRKPKWTRWF